MNLKPITYSKKTKNYFCLSEITPLLQIVSLCYKLSITRTITQCLGTF